MLNGVSLQKEIIILFHFSAIQLFYTVRNMFELYCNVVPTYHKQRLVSNKFVFNLKLIF